MMKKIFFLPALFLLPLAAGAQALFTMTPLLVEASKPSTNFIMYNYSDIENLSGDTLYMRWVRVSETSASGSMGDWATAISDPSNNFLDATGIDSADFVLKPVSDAYDKFIYQLYPNNMAGELTAVFRIFPIDSPDQALEVTFHYLVTEPVSDVAEVETVEAPLFFPNPVVKGLLPQWQGPEEAPVQVFNASGEWALTTGPLPKGQFLPVAGLTPGWYRVVCGRRMASLVILD